MEALWRWLREDVTDHHCQASAEDLIRRVGAFEARLNQTPSSSPTASGSRIPSTQMRRNSGSQLRRGLAFIVYQEAFLNGWPKAQAPRPSLNLYRATAFLLKREQEMLTCGPRL